MAEVRFTEQSITDLEDIAGYISKDSQFYAQMQVQKLISRINILERFPEIGRIVPELKTKSIRELVEGNYRIIYHIGTKELVHILTFHHSRRKIRNSGIRKLIKPNR